MELRVSFGEVVVAGRGQASHRSLDCSALRAGRARAIDRRWTSGGFYSVPVELADRFVGRCATCFPDGESMRPGDARSSRASSHVSAPAPSGPEIRAAWQAARQFLSWGMPLFVARPAIGPEGLWDPDGGHRATGYWFPKGWHQTRPRLTVLSRWRPGMALCAVTGFGIDLLDTDPRNGGEGSRKQLVRAGAWPTVWFEESAMTIPAPAEVGRLLDASEHAPLFAVCAFAGLRLGEAAALKPEDIDAEARTITVRRQVQRERWTDGRDQAPQGGVRARGLRARPARSRCCSSTSRATGRLEWLFADDAQPPPHQNTVGHWWRTACKKTGVSYRLHDLRHFYASGLIAAGCDVVTVQRALGHSKATTTLDTYSHLWPTAEDRTRKAAAALLADSLRTARGMHAVSTCADAP